MQLVGPDPWISIARSCYYKLRVDASIGLVNDYFKVARHGMRAYVLSDIMIRFPPTCGDKSYIIECPFAVSPFASLTGIWDGNKEYYVRSSIYKE